LVKVSLEKSEVTLISRAGTEAPIYPHIDNRQVPNRPWRPFYDRARRRLQKEETGFLGRAEITAVASEDMSFFLELLLSFLFSSLTKV